MNFIISSEYLYNPLRYFPNLRFFLKLDVNYAIGWSEVWYKEMGRNKSRRVSLSGSSSLHGLSLSPPPFSEHKDLEVQAEKHCSAGIEPAGFMAQGWRQAVWWDVFVGRCCSSVEIDPVVLPHRDRSRLSLQAGNISSGREQV